MVSSPRLRSPGTHSASAIIPVPEKSSIAQHKEIFTVLFDPPSFLIVYSIVCHLWKKSKMKKFLPLPPLQKSQQQSIHIQEPLIDSISEAKEIQGCIVKIRENEKFKNLELLNQEVKVGEKFHKVKAKTSNHIGDISFATIAKLKKDFPKSMDLVEDSRRDYFSITVKNHSTSSFASHVLEGTVLLDLDFVSIQMCRLLHRINNTMSK
ncbi:hypothetical protein A2U01_0018956 [Trifolium medium]|uniref:Uncharacterized protein n=1 Tax=Trifolium medium TaxID=97028 RepID=A0A392NFU7_9FABA|nr:hypothetical protein [Trifolium medium]